MALIVKGHQAEAEAVWRLTSFLAESSFRLTHEELINEAHDLFGKENWEDQRNQAKAFLLAAFSQQTTVTSVENSSVTQSNVVPFPSKQECAIAEPDLPSSNCYFEPIDEVDHTSEALVVCGPSFLGRVEKVASWLAAACFVGILPIAAMAAYMFFHKTTGQAFYRSSAAIELTESPRPTTTDRVRSTFAAFDDGLRQTEYVAPVAKPVERRLLDGSIGAFKADEMQKQVSFYPEGLFIAQPPVGVDGGRGPVIAAFGFGQNVIASDRRSIVGLLGIIGRPNEPASRF